MEVLIQPRSTSYTDICTYLLVRSVVTELKCLTLQMTRFLLYLCYILKWERKNYYGVFSFPLLSWFFEHTQCTALLCCWVLQQVRWPRQCYQLMKFPRFQHCHLSLFIMLSLSLGGGSVDTQPAASAQLKRQQMAARSDFCWFCCQGIHCQSLLKRDLSFYQMCSRTSEQQSCYSYLVYSFLIWKPKVFIRVRSSFNNRISGAHPQEQGNLLGQWIVTFFCMCYIPPVHNKQSQKSHSNREASLTPWTDSLFSFSSFIYLVEFSLRRR